MKVETNITLFAGAEPDFAHVVKTDENTEKSDKERKTIFAGDFRGNQTLQERIQQRKEEARQEALKIVRDTWAGDQAIDQGLDERREHIRQLQEEKKQIQDELRDVEGKRAELMDMYGVTEETPLEEQPEEYREWMQDLNDREFHNKKLLAKNEQDIIVENAVIRGTKLERLKKDPMVKAQKQADAVLEAAGDEIMGMVMDAGREHLDEEQAKREEKAEELKEEKEKLEEIQEKRDERQEELEELIEDIPVDEMLELDRAKDNIQQEVQNIVDKMKLVAEDIKGAMVDTSV